MAREPLLMIPGPVRVSGDVLLEASRPLVSHVSEEFDSIHRESAELLSRLLDADGSIILPGSGGLALELAARFTVKPGDRVVVLSSGFFGWYWEMALRGAGADVVVFRVKPGQGWGYEEASRALSEAGDVKAVFMQHVETSTGVVNDVRGVARAARESGALLVVDGVASVGGVELKLREWGVHLVAAASQKALAAPPGLALLAYTNKWLEEANREPRGPYTDLEALLAEMESTRNYRFTPSVSLVRALHASLQGIHAEPPRERYRRHEAIAEAVRAGLEAMGLEVVAEEGYRSPTVTAAWLPRGVEWPSLYREARRAGAEIAGGLGELKGRILRVGHMGDVTPWEALGVVAALERALARLGALERVGPAVAAAQEALHRKGF